MAQCFMRRTTARHLPHPALLEPENDRVCNIAGLAGNYIQVPGDRQFKSRLCTGWVLARREMHCQIHTLPGFAVVQNFLRMSYISVQQGENTQTEQAVNELSRMVQFRRNWYPSNREPNLRML